MPLYFWVFIEKRLHLKTFAFYFSQFKKKKKSLLFLRLILNLFFLFSPIFGFFCVMQVGHNPCPEHVGTWDNRRGLKTFPHRRSSSNQTTSFDRRRRRALGWQIFYQAPPVAPSQQVFSLLERACCQRSLSAPSSGSTGVSSLGKCTSPPTRVRCETAATADIAAAERYLVDVWKCF